MMSEMSDEEKNERPNKVVTAFVSLRGLLHSENAADCNERMEWMQINRHACFE